MALPTLALDKNNLTLDAGSNEGTFIAKNTGGGTLSGHILSRCQGLEFSPVSWEGNSQVITYKFSQDSSQKNNGLIEAHAYVCSNGGEFLLPVFIDTAPMVITTDEGLPIKSVQDLYAYSQSYPAEARRLFTSSEFYMLLLSTAYPYLEVYESLHKDPNRERAVDNFFQVSGLKGKTRIYLETDRLDIVQHPVETGQVYFYVRKTDNGYADAPISVEESVPWLALSSTRIATADYDQDNSARIGIEINPNLMTSPFANIRIYVGDEALTLSVRKAPRVSLRLNREGFKYQDRGALEVENNSGFDLAVEVRSRDRHVRFYRTSYTVPPGGLSIPFEIRQSAFFGTRRVFRRLPYISTYVDVRARCTAQEYKRRLYLNIGEW